MSKIIVNRENFKVDEIELEHGTLTIGRGKDNDLTIDDRTVSNHHANIVTIFGSSYIEDLDSTNGTFINGKRTSTHTLHNGDVVTIGHYQLLFQGETADNPLQATNATQMLNQDEVANLLEKANRRNKEKAREQRAQVTPLHATQAVAGHKHPTEKPRAAHHETSSIDERLPDIDNPDLLQDESLAPPRGEMHHLRKTDTSPITSLKTIVLAVLAASITFGLLYAFYLR